MLDFPGFSHWLRNFVTILIMFSPGYGVYACEQLPACGVCCDLLKSSSSDAMNVSAASPGGVEQVPGPCAAPHCPDVSIPLSGVLIAPGAPFQYAQKGTPLAVARLPTWPAARIVIIDTAAEPQHPPDGGEPVYSETQRLRI